jgi:hypothetical protein
MAHHKVVAIKMAERNGELVITALTESPRGTRIPFQQRKIPKNLANKAARNAAIELAVAEMLAVQELPF